MSTAQLLQMAVVDTDRFRITGFAVYTTQGTVMKQNIQATETQVISMDSYVTLHSTLYAIHNT